MDLIPYGEFGLEVIRRGVKLARDNWRAVNRIGLGFVKRRMSGWSASASRPIHGWVQRKKINENIGCGEVTCFARIAPSIF